MPFSRVFQSASCMILPSIMIDYQSRLESQIFSTILCTAERESEREREINDSCLSLE